MSGAFLSSLLRVLGRGRTRQVQTPAFKHKLTDASVILKSDFVP